MYNFASNRDPGHGFLNVTLDKLGYNHDHGAKITGLLFYLLHEDYAGSRGRLVQSLLKSLRR